MPDPVAKAPKKVPKKVPTKVPNDHTKYLILGCGSTGYNIAEELIKETDDIILVDQDEKRVEDLRDQKYEAFVRDQNDPNLFKGLPAPGVIFVMSNDKEANLAVVRTARNVHPKSHIIVRTIDPVSEDAFRDAGADLVIYPQEVVAKAAVHHTRKLISSRMARRLYDYLSEADGALGIVVHTNPDPDAISSAMALAAIAAAASEGRLESRILYDGTIGHQENRAFVNLLEIEMEHLGPETLNACNYIALLDSHAPGVNNGLDKKSRVNIIIDHHPTGEAPAAGADFIDNRTSIGATASILTQYLQELDIPVDKKLATALLYGIRADTRDFRRNITPQDLNYAAFLLPLTDSAMLDQITSPSMAQETLDILGSAIRNRKISSGYLFSNVGYVRNRDALPQAADLLISLESVNTVIVYGIGDENIYLSARNRDVRLHIGNVISEAFGDFADAGGHATMAAASIPLTYFRLVKDKEKLLSLVIEPLLNKFTSLVGLDNGDEDEA